MRAACFALALWAAAATTAGAETVELGPEQLLQAGYLALDAGDAARVRVALSREAGRSVLRVEDSGPGLGDEQRAHLGERFFRVLGTAAPGSGLGWSIVRRIAAVHGAEIDTARSQALGGLAVRVSFAAEATLSPASRSPAR